MADLLTKGFKTERHRLNHYHKHGASYGAATPEDYEVIADKFLGGVL